MAETTIPPWHMWGMSQEARLDGIALASSSVRVTQMARIEYKRPETWHFLLFVGFEDITVVNPVAVGIDFRIVLGLGRDSVELNPFVRFEWLPGELVPGVPRQRWVTKVQGEPPSSVLFTPVEINTTEHIVAQSISCDAEVFSEGSLGAGNIARFRVGAYFSPLAHVRPDWFRHDFTGGEVRGK